MPMPRATRFVEAALITLLIVLAIISLVVIKNISLNNMQAPSAELANGVMLRKALPIDNFKLQDHQGRPFTPPNFVGKWHIVAYGYINCPDLCPMTVTVLSQLAALLQQQKLSHEVKVVFYTVDPLRDTSERLAQYLNYFSPAIIGLTKSDDGSFMNFQQSMNINVKYGAPDAQNNYLISHDLNMLVLNPLGNLQAILTPELDPFGKPSLSSNTLFADFTKVRDTYNNSR